jgi:hypothetical protein
VQLLLQVPDPLAGLELGLALLAKGAPCLARGGVCGLAG